MVGWLDQQFSSIDQGSPYEMEGYSPTLLATSRRRINAAGVVTLLSPLPFLLPLSTVARLTVLRNLPLPLPCLHIGRQTGYI